MWLEGVTIRKSPNVGNKMKFHKGITLHITDDSGEGEAVNWLTSRESKVSSHFVIERCGAIFQLVDTDTVAWHCGIVQKPTSLLYNIMGMSPNFYMIGIEFVALEHGYLTDEQKESGVWLIRTLMEMYDIGFNCILGHNEFDSVDRANDPISTFKKEDFFEMINKIINIEGKLSTLDNLNSELKNKISNLEKNNIIFSTFESLPEWAKPTIQKLMNMGLVKGESTLSLSLSLDVVKTLVILDRAEVFEK
jgi:N-acetyl-anhydromuramyl-L-alanine amidase AmpD